MPVSSELEASNAVRAYFRAQWLARYPGFPMVFDNEPYEQQDDEWLRFRWQSITSQRLSLNAGVAPEQRWRVRRTCAIVVTFYVQPDRGDERADELYEDAFDILDSRVVQGVHLGQVPIGTTTTRKITGRMVEDGAYWSLGLYCPLFFDLHRTVTVTP